MPLAARLSQPLLPLLLSPAAGSMALAAPSVTADLARGTALGRTVMAPPAQVDGVPRTEGARSRSAAVPWLTPGDLGAMVGLAAAKADEARVREALRARGIETNKVRGEHTGVSLAKHANVVELIAQAMHGDDAREARALPLVARVAWEKAQSKADVLDFAKAAASHFPEALADAHIATDDGAQSWLAATLVPSDVTHERAAAAAQALLRGKECAESLEAVAAMLTTRRGGRMQVRLERHSFDGAPDVPDCVEAVARELIEFVLFDTRTGALDAARLPPGADAGLREWIGEFPCGGGGRAASELWFPLCQRHPSVAYLSRTAAHQTVGDYEVSPTRRDLAQVVSRLLFGTAADSLKDVAAMWNTTAGDRRSPKLEVEERVDVFRSIAGDEHRLRFLSRARLVGEPGVLHLELQEHPPTASAVSTPCAEEAAVWLRDVPPASQIARDAPPLAWWVASAVDDARAFAHAF